PPDHASPLSLHDALPISMQRNDPRCTSDESITPTAAAPTEMGTTINSNSPAIGISESGFVPLPAPAATSGSRSGTKTIGHHPTIDRKSTRLNSSHVAISY